MDFRTIDIKLAKIPTSSEKIEIISEFVYYYNPMKKFEDLKEFIFDLSNGLFCPCFLGLYQNKNNDEKPLYIKDFEKLDYGDTDSLSSKDLGNILYVMIDSNKECECSETFKKNFYLSKKQLANLISNKSENILKENEEVKIDEIKGLISNQLYSDNKRIDRKNNRKKKKQHKKENVDIEHEKNEHNKNDDNIQEELANYDIETQEKEESEKNKENEIKLEEIETERDKLVEEKKILNDKINKMNNFNQKLSEELEKIKKEKNFTSVAVNKDLGTITKLQENDISQNLEITGNKIIIDEKTNQIKEINLNNDGFKELENFYDVIINIKSVKDIEKGWEIKMTEKGENNFILFKDLELIKIGVIGNSNKGKSFILSRISKIILPSGTSIKTEGLSIKYPELKEIKNRKIVLLDSAGLETPVLNEISEVASDDDEDEHKKKDIKINNNKTIEMTEENEDEKEKNANTNNQANATDSGDKKDNKNNEDIFREKSREKLITELFLENYIIFNSDILLLVVGIMTYSEQKLLNKIKRDIEKFKINKTLFIIHNLKTYTSKAQVQEYIKNNLKRSSTFKLKKGHKISTKLEDISGEYYFEKNSNPKIFHLIFANEGSEAGDYYNNFTLEFIEHYFQNVTDLKPFDIIQTVKERFARLSTDIIEQTGEKPFSIDDIISNEEALKNKLIRLKKPKEIILKRCLIDELGFSNLKGSGFEPCYNYYKKDNKLIIRLEVPGNASVQCKRTSEGEYTVIKINGIKKEDKEFNTFNNYCSTREFGEFHVNILLNAGELIFKSAEPKIDKKNGLIFIEYGLEEKKDKATLEISEEDQV